LFNPQGLNPFKNVLSKNMMLLWLVQVMRVLKLRRQLVNLGSKTLLVTMSLQNVAPNVL
jgi:hypothetical protein